ncbi:sensory histidine kinase QseC [Sulfuriferula multivorans]|uniref:histidine kinase n=1 Tax=Sulfuriferula multivorans TaxID=1559896 RepID=A0A401JDT6_9PROT|nr:ATP-binding protein [Sulfuriferula multivorans]GBL45720.1 sensory histidine kinase QseC [Sulfuriferula multivorans]
MIKPSGSLQGRLLALVLAVVVGVWLVTAAMTWFDARYELDELLDSHLAQAAALLVVQQTREVEDDGPGIDTPTLHRYAPKVAFQVFHEGRLVLRSANAPVTPMVESGKDIKTGFATAQIKGIAWRVFAAYGAERDVQVYVGEQASSRDSILWAVLRSTLWPMVVALPLLALAVWWAVYRGVAPMRRLGRALAERQPQALHPVALDGISSEMAPMINALNGLFERIGTLLESERRFTADAAHELRTPIAAIRAQAQVALGEADDALRRHALKNTLEGCDRATRLVEQLLTLSRLEAVTAPAMAAVDLSALTQLVVAELAPKALAKHQTLEFDATEPCSVPGNETLLAVLVRNLVDNAVRYSPASAQVKVSVRQQAGRVVLSVEDSGPGLADTDRNRLGERFFRVPGSSESGSGLGWSIVRRIAAVHRLDMQVETSAELGGLAVRVIGQANVGTV